MKKWAVILMLLVAGQALQWWGGCGVLRAVFTVMGRYGLWMMG